jgi:hypothetical protein
MSEKEKNALSNSTNNFVNFCNLLTLLFIALKLTGVISWSWLLVLLPTILRYTIGVLILIICYLIKIAIEKY